MKFPARLKELRLQFGCTQKSMADICGITERAYRNYELGRNEPSIDNLIKMADLFHVSVDYLICRDMPENPLVNTK